MHILFLFFSFRKRSIRVGVFFHSWVLAVFQADQSGVFFSSRVHMAYNRSKMEES